VFSYETLITMNNIWCPSISTYIPVSIHYSISVEDGSFSHDWHPGAVQKDTIAIVEGIYYSFQYKGKHITFNPQSGALPLVEFDEYDKQMLESNEAAAVFEAIDSFEHPEGIFYIEEE
jgi:hypothetical protein